MILTLQGRLAPTPKKIRLWEGHFQDLKLTNQSAGFGHVGPMRVQSLTIGKTLSDSIISIFDHRYKIIGFLFNILTIFGQYLHNIWTIFRQYWTNICTIFGQYLGNIQVVFIQYLGNI